MHLRLLHENGFIFLKSKDGERIISLELIKNLFKALGLIYLNYSIMGSKENRTRGKWQDYGGANALRAEQSFFDVFTKEFEGTDFSVRANPNEFKNIYVDVELTESVLGEIYTPENPVTKHGITPDYAIDNNRTGKTIYIEVKRQDGWVEGGKRSDGRGNAHERSCKYFTPGLLKSLRDKGNLHDAPLPFWVIFQGDITRDPCRVREITLWYQELEDHFFMWRDNTNPITLIEHFDLKLKAYLE